MDSMKPGVVRRKWQGEHCFPNQARLYVTGLANSGDFPTTVGAYDTTHNGNADAFVTKLDLIGAPVTLTLEPATDTNVVGEQHCVTATVRDFGGTPVPGVTVRFSVPTHAFADTNGSGTQNPDEPFADATKAWTLPPGTSFWGTVKGSEAYQDHGPAAPRKVKSIRLLATTCSPDHTSATIFGTAKVDGAGEFGFRIDVTDAGKPGTNDNLRDCPQRRLRVRTEAAPDR